MCLLALASSGSLLLLLLTALSTSRQDALSSFRKMRYVAIARWKSLKFWKNPPEDLFYLLLTLLYSVRQSSAKVEVTPFDDAERMLLFTGPCVGKRSKFSSHISNNMCTWEKQLPVLWYQIHWTAHIYNKHSISVTLYRKQRNLFHSLAPSCMHRREGEFFRLAGGLKSGTAVKWARGQWWGAERHLPALLLSWLELESSVVQTMYGSHPAYTLPLLSGLPEGLMRAGEWVRDLLRYAARPVTLKWSGAHHYGHRNTHLGTKP